ncbi:MAG: HDOD domain-containing protein [Myxococcales bacterium]|nr:HDOD domain-containing protein [Myxococcales bacterium]MCB9736381.1 HDOD domain-containing protein [Deltaproteobacteria bacterium]
MQHAAGAAGAPDTLVLASSPPLRAALTSGLAGASRAPRSVVNWTEALHVMRSDGLPEGCVVSSQLESPGLGIRFATALAELPKTRKMPVVLIISGAEDFSLLQRTQLPLSVVPVVEYTSLSSLVESVRNAYGRAQRAAGAASPPAAEALTSHDPAVGALEDAFHGYDEVVQAFVERRLPGPVLPDVVAKTRALLADPNLEFRAVASFVEHNQVFAGRLMSLANSAYYGRGARVSSVQLAVSRLGLGMTTQILQAAAMRSFVVGAHPELTEVIAFTLQFGHFVGLIADWLARRTRTAQPAEAYTAGLFHNLGETFFAYTISLLVDQGRVAAPDPEALLTAARARAYDLNRRLVDSAGFPEAIARLYDCQDCGDDAVVAVVQQAIWAACGYASGGAQAVRGSHEFGAFGLDARVVSELADALDNLWATTAAI